MPKRRLARPQIETTRMVAALYASLLGRPPTRDEVASNLEFLEGGGAIHQIVGSMLASRECQQSYFRNPFFDEIAAPDPLPVDVRRLYFCHLPKTGGVSLREMLRPHFSELEFCGDLNFGELYRMSLYRLRSYRLIAGHFGPTLPELLPDVPLITATLIREPVAMVASHYMHWRDQGNPQDPLTALAKGMEFDQWCRIEATAGLWSDPQATALCSPRIPPTRQQAQINPEGGTTGVPRSELHERAIATLDQIDIVGTTEDLLLAYRACLRSLDIEPTLDDAVKANTGAGLGADITTSTRDWLLEHNTIDAALFDLARSRRPGLVTAAAAGLLPFGR